MARRVGNGEATIAIERRRGRLGEPSRGWMVRVDGVERGTLRPGEAFELTVAPGSHRVDAGSGPSRSAELAVAAFAGERTLVLCGRRGWEAQLRCWSAPAAIGSSPPSATSDSPAV